ncbi:MAG: dolichyl-phosphate beta-D-mannosyltransferase [bacterium]|nr:MAG: dolichyl-phosphate beta-D-mannosyltransferase [bacterium]
MDKPGKSCSMKALVILPTYNEKENIENIIQAISNHQSLDILVVDDHSPDGTGEIVDRLVQQHQRLQVIHRSGKLGLGTAYIEGFKYALQKDYDCVFEMDADFSHNPQDLHRLLEEINRYDLVIGSRYIPGGSIVGWGPIRYIISMGGNVLARWILKLPIQDCTAGFRCYKTQILKELPLDEISSEGYGFQVEILFHCHLKGFSIKEIPITFTDRQVGQSKMNKKIIVEAFKRLIQLRRQYL